MATHIIAASAASSIDPSLLAGDVPAGLADAPAGRWIALCAADALSPTELLAAAPREIADYVTDRLSGMDMGMGTLEDARLMFAYLRGVLEAHHG